MNEAVGLVLHMVLHGVKISNLNGHDALELCCCLHNLYLARTGT